MQSLATISRVLSDIVELGYVRIENGSLAEAVKPIFNVYSSMPGHPIYSDRWDITIQYLSDYARFHPYFNGSYFLCLYDGWREQSEGAEESDRVYLEWYSHQVTFKRIYGVG